MGILNGHPEYQGLHGINLRFVASEGAIVIGMTDGMSEGFPSAVLAPAQAEAFAFAILGAVTALRVTTSETGD